MASLANNSKNKGRKKGAQKNRDKTTTTNKSKQSNRSKSNKPTNDNSSSSNNNRNKNKNHHHHHHHHNNNNRRRKRPQNKSINSFYKLHEPLDSVQLQLTSGNLLTGTVRINSKKRDQAFVTVDGIPSDIFIDGDKYRNRALNGDKVVLRLLDESKWTDTSLLKHLTTTDEDTRTEEEINTAALHEREVQKLWNPVVPKELDFYNNTTPTNPTTPQNEEEKTSSHHTPNDLGSEARRLVMDGLANGKQAQAEVVHILQRGCCREIIGVLEPFCHASKVQRGRPLPQQENFVKFKPMDSRYPFMLLPRHKAPKEFVADPLGCAIRTQMYVGLPHVFDTGAWAHTSRFPKISLSRPLGEAGEISAETEALLVQHGFGRRGVDGDFSQDVLDCLEGFRRPVAPTTTANTATPTPTPTTTTTATAPTDGDDPRTGWTIPPEEISKRRDLRQHRIFSIDPTTAKDLDDALHVTQLPDGRIELGVHIADVSYYVKPGNSLDDEAQIRATTVYLVQKSLPMLPRLLSENLCSLNPNEDRLAYSCIWWMTPEGNMTNDEPWYGRSVIRSCCKLDYGLAQHMIEGTVKDGTTSNVDAWPLDRRPTGGHRCPDVCRDVRLMNRIAKQRRARRYESGALALQGVKLCFQCDHQGNPVETFTYPIKDSNRLVEEYMLLANYLVAQKLILGAGKLASIRRHPTPIPKKMEEFAKQCQERGYDVDIKSAGALHQSLLNIQSNASIDPIAHYALTTSATVPMKPAVYFAAGTESREQWRHYALNIPYYTHFTSPIRRYADIMVHRLLTAVLTNTVDQFALNTGQIQKILDNCNEKKENSKAAQLRGDTVYFCVFLKHQPRISEAVVMDWGESSFELFVPEYGVSKRVHIDDLNCQSETKPNGFHLRPNNGANKQGKQGKQGEQKNSGGSNKESIGMYSGCRMMNRNVLPKHGMFVKFLTRMTVKLYHLDKIPVDFALEIQDIYAWEKK